MYALVTLAATLVVVTISGLIIAVAPRLVQHDARRAAYGDPDPDLPARRGLPGEEPDSMAEVRQRL